MDNGQILIGDIMTLTEFENTYVIGGSYGYNGYVGQCVSLAKLYIKNVLEVKPISIGNAKEYWLKRNTSNYLKKNFEFHDKPHRGDLFVRTSGTYGHIGIVLKVTDNFYYTLEQNNGGTKTVSKQKYRYPNGFHFLHPINQTNIEKQQDYKDDTNNPNEDREDSPNHDEHSLTDDISTLILLNII